MRESIPWYIWAGVAGRHLRLHRRRLGRLLAPLHRPRHLLDPGPHGDLRLRSPRRDHLRLPRLSPPPSATISQLRAASVNVLGFRAPLGVFIAAWGGIAMLTSAPFDNWWHNAYGLDVKIVSPPHTLLILGIRAVAVGMLFLILAAMNRASRVDSRHRPTSSRLQRLFLYIGGLIVAGQMFFLMEYTWDVVLHRASAYIAMGIALPIALRRLLAGLALPLGRDHHRRHLHALRHRRDPHPAALPGAAQARPRLLSRHPHGPGEVPHPDPRPRPRPRSPLAAHPRLEALAGRARLRRPLHRRPLRGRVALRQLPACPRPARTASSAPSTSSYNSRPAGYDRLRQFFQPDHGLALYLGLLRAAVCAAIRTWIGLSFGRWMRSVQR